MGPNKAHGHDGVSVRMSNLSCPCIIKPLLIIFSNFLKFGTFPDDWKKGNAVPVHKKDNKQIVDNYHPVSLLPICSNVSEKLAFDAIFEFMIEKNLLSINQSGFKPNDSWVNQLISITCSIFNALGANPSLEVCGDFLDLSKAFDRVWH